MKEVIAPWKSRKAQLFALSFVVGIVAAFTGNLTYELITFLCALPTAYGILNVSQKIKLDKFEVDP